MVSYQPESIDELAKLIASADRGSRLVPKGLGTNLFPVFDNDLFIDLSSFDRVEYRADDMTVTAGAGVTMSHLDQVLADRRQRLIVEPPADGTIGAMVATGSRGPLVYRYGGIRDIIIGIQVVLGDGLVARSGGLVIKNVAGYDLAKLFVGSRGLAGVVTEVTFRTHPLPEETYIVAVPVAARDTPELLKRLYRLDVEPVGAEWMNGKGYVLFEGRKGVAARQAEIAVARLESACEIVPGKEMLRAVAQERKAREGNVAFTVSVRPAKVPMLLEGMKKEFALEPLTGHMGTGHWDYQLEMREVATLKAAASWCHIYGAQLEVRSLSGSSDAISRFVADRVIGGLAGRVFKSIDPTCRFTGDLLGSSN
jgi:glycolate oxidase FAD binding subunit